MFKQIGMDIGDFTICLGDKENYKGSRPYIDNTSKSKIFGKKYEDLDDPYMYVDQQLIIARMNLTKELIILQFDRTFKNIIDGYRCVEIENDYETEARYKYTYSFNSWLTKK